MIKLTNILHNILNESLNLVIDKKYKDIRNDSDFYPFNIIDENNNIIGNIEVIYLNYLDAYQISNSKVNEKNKGYGKEAYLLLFKKLDKPVYSDSSLTTDAENLWKSLVKNGYAVYNENEKKYKSKK
jgi:hypothetical protein